MTTMREGKPCFAPGAFPGRVLNELRYLGPRITAENSNVPERGFRVAALKQGFAKYMGFWNSSTNIRLKRVIYIGVVQSPALSAQETSVLKRPDYRATDGPMTKQLRSMAMGSTCNKDGQPPKSWATIDIWRYWHLCPAALELRVRRLVWLQAMINDQEANAHPIAALFGSYRFEEQGGGRGT